MKTNLLCLSFGHKEFFTGDGSFCLRCSKNTYFNEDWDKSGYLLKPYFWINRKFCKIQDLYRRIRYGKHYLPF